MFNAAGSSRDMARTLKRLKEWVTGMAEEFLSEAMDYIDHWLECQKLQDRQTPGYSVAISHKGEILYKQAFGYADLETQEKMTPAHLFRVASHSKTFTAIAIMQLMAAGKLSIYEPAARYLPFLKENPDKRLQDVTIEQMLCHGSGICGNGEDPSFWGLEKRYPTKGEMVSFFKTEPLVIESDVRFKYSNYAYGLLGWIVEEVSGLSYADYMREQILKPLGLKRIGAEYDPESGPYVTGYTPLLPDGKQAPMGVSSNTGELVGATGFYSDAESLCRFYSAVIPGSGLLLPDDLKRKMLSRKWDMPDEDTKRGYALGFLCDEQDGRALKGHYGGMPGNMTQTLFDGQDDVVVSVLTNSQAGKPDILQKGIWHIIDFFKAHYEEPSPYKKYAGQFYDIWETFRFVPLGKKIYVSVPTEAEPFKNCSELTHQKGNIFKITKETGYGSYGEAVEFVMEGKDVKRVKYGGFPKYAKQDYLDYIEKVKKKYN